MDGASILLVVAALDVSFGWQPDAEDPRAYEVTAQIEPELLDVLKSGPSVPIEAHVPDDVKPIRRVRIVVGTSPLPRKSITSVSKSTERIVRGQEPQPRPHTAQYQNSPWTDDRYSSANPTTVPPPPTRQYDQRGATIGVDNIRTAQAPSPWDRAQTAVTETTNGLRDGVEAGIRQANDQFTSAGQQLSNSASQLGQSANEQFRSLTGTGGQSQPTTWPAPPPSSFASSNQPITPLTAPSLSAPPTRTAASAPVTPLPSTPWSSMNPNLAPPRFMNPTITSPTNAPPASTNRLAQAPSGPTFPASSGNVAAPPLHSVLADPAASNRGGSALPPPPTTSQNWANGWGSASTPAATIGGAQPTSSPPASAPVVDNRYTPQPAAGSNSKDLWAGFPAPQPQATPPSTLPASSPQPAAQFAKQPVPSLPPASQPQNPSSAGQPAITTATQHSNSPTAPTGEQLPWIPLLVVSVSLAGSLAANIFLGWSYADARFRYRNLVRKTTSSFHRATGAAA